MIIGVVGGTLLFLVGMITLGIGGLILAFGGALLVIDKLIPDISILGVNMSSFIEAGIGLGLVTKIFDTLRNVVGGLMDRFLELSFVKDTFEKLGVTIDDSKTAWQNLKALFTAGLDKIKEKLGIVSGDEEGGLGFFESIIKDVKDTWDEFSSDFIQKVEDMGVPDFVDSFIELGDSISDMLPSLQSLATSLEVIADALKIIKSVVTSPVKLVDWLGAKSQEMKDSLAILRGRTPSIGYYTKGNRQTGGFIPHEGLYRLHAGERVQSAGEVNMNFSPTINFSTSSSGGISIDMIKRELGRAWADELARATRY